MKNQRQKSRCHVSLSHHEPSYNYLVIQFSSGGVVLCILYGCSTHCTHWGVSGCFTYICMMPNYITALRPNVEK